VVRNKSTTTELSLMRIKIGYTWLAYNKWRRVENNHYNKWGLQCSGGASFFDWGGQTGARHLGGKSIWLPITHFHNKGHILHYSKFPSLSLDLSVLFASYGSFPFHLSFIPISRPSPSSDTARGLGKRCKLPPAGPGGARPPNGIWWILGLEMSVF